MKRKGVIVMTATILVVCISYILYGFFVPTPSKMSYNDFLDASGRGKISKVYLNDDESFITLEDNNGKKFITDNPRTEAFKEYLLKHDIEVKETRGQFQIRNFAILIGGSIIVFMLLSIISKNGSKQLQKNNRISSMQITPVNSMHIRFDDVAGNEEAKESMRDLVDFIKNPEKYSKYGARLPRGVILYGPPGTGKTLMAKAVAGEAGVPFYSVSGSDFVQVYVGVGASRVRELFKKAREKGKCVIFIDEIDALGKKRDGGMDGSGNDERDQTLNALLAEMSGFNDSQGIVVIAATNRLDILDEALLRPGRFDRHIEIGLPDVKGRLQILKLHSQDKPMGKDVDLHELAHQTVYFSGAKLESMMNEAAIMAAKRDSGCIEQEDIQRAFYTVVAGAEKKDRSAISSMDKKITAFHEAGHALITKLMVPKNRVSKVTIIPSTKGAAGFSMNIPPDSMYSNKTDMENNIRICLAGRAAEEVIFGKARITTGASNDLEKATQIVINMVRRFGMNEKCGLLNYDILYKNGMGAQDMNMIAECKAHMDIIYKEVMGKLVQNKDTLYNIANALLKKETLEEHELDEIMNIA